ncbi:DUF3027 domain-containing protein [Corynebacterium lizhenjunii]|uniref:DUF3027 domain-containing protein n=1 Tax=Corynebacterium lizhenjunii TaxID=2709394 RepID=A0A7T0PD05_9CORY|nr:DUF3027 domain-containing protein [Corynebacterium lizhenjunii]QPK80282.1 DUF3027 domain-containing protein [Corynebacterium lizhenjunii]
MSAPKVLLGAQAVATAREALEELGEGGIGAHVGVAGISKNVVTHRFEAYVPGYSGWEWQAVLACAAGSSDVTVNEVALVPGGNALQAPEWVPYAERVQPGDLGPGDLMPLEPDDERVDDSGNLTEAAMRSARQRWMNGDYGPRAEMATASPLQCRTCAFLLPMMTNFGVCANEYSADGRVVHATYGCGAHSGITARRSEEAAKPVFDDEKLVF